MADDADASPEGARIAQPAAEQSLSERLSRFAVSAVRFAEDRLNLLRWEAAHEGSRLGAMLLRGFCAALLALFTLESLTLFLVASFWDTHWRMHVIGGVACLALVATFFMTRAFLAKRDEKSGLLHRPAPLTDDYEAPRL